MYNVSNLNSKKCMTLILAMGIAALTTLSAAATPTRTTIGHVRVLSSHLLFEMVS